MEAGAAPLQRAQAAGLVRKDLRPMDIRLIATLLGTVLVSFVETADLIQMSPTTKIVRHG